MAGFDGSGDSGQNVQREYVYEGRDEREGSGSPGGPASVNFSGIIKDAWSCYKENFAKLLLLVLLVTLPLAIVQVYVVDMRFDFGGVYGTVLDMVYGGGEAAASSQEVSNLTLRLVLYALITALLESVSLITEAGAVILVGEKFKNAAPPEPDSFVEEIPSDKVTFPALFEAAVKSFPKLWVTMFIVRLTTSLGLMLCVIPGLFLYYVFAFSAYSVELTGLWGRRATFVSSLCTRRFPKQSLTYALTFYLFTSVGLSFMVEGLDKLFKLTGLSAGVLGAFSVGAVCLKQLMFLFAVSCGAVLFIRMLPVIDPLIDESGVRKSRKTM